MSLKLNKEEKERVTKAPKECEDAKRIFQILWPDLFKNKQTYCCDDFKVLVEGGIVTSDGHDNPDWEFKGKSENLIDVCPFSCGEELIDPIEKEEI